MPIRARARATGFTEREVFFIDRTARSGTRCSRRRSRCRCLPSGAWSRSACRAGKPGVTGAAALLRAARGRRRRSAAADPHRPARARDAERASGCARCRRAAHGCRSGRSRARSCRSGCRRACAHAGLDVGAEALALLAERSEGNLLAAQQEVDKLALLLPPRRRGERRRGCGQQRRQRALRCTSSWRGLRGRWMPGGHCGCSAACRPKAPSRRWCCGRCSRTACVLRPQAAAAPGSRTVRASGAAPAPFARLVARAAAPIAWPRDACAAMPGMSWRCWPRSCAALRTLPLPRRQARLAHERRRTLDTDDRTHRPFRRHLRSDPLRAPAHGLRAVAGAAVSPRCASCPPAIRRIARDAAGQRRAAAGDGARGGGGPVRLRGR